MFKASEANALAKSNDYISSYLALIELNIKNEAKQGKFHVSLSGGVTENQKDRIVEALKDAGYVVSVKSGSVENLYHFYISWA